MGVVSHTFHTLFHDVPHVPRACALAYTFDSDFVHSFCGAAGEKVPPVPTGAGYPLTPWRGRSAAGRGQRSGPLTGKPAK